MSGVRRGLFDNRAWLLPVFVVAMGVHFALQTAAFPDVFHTLNVVGSDDAMRLVSVRDLIAGQGWFDTTQYRVLPPEGISLHWSRLVDAALAIILLGLEPLIGMNRAEIWLTALWPGLLFAGYLWALAAAGKVAFSPGAAALAMLVAAVLPMVNAAYFPFGRLDHHGLQVLCIAAVVAFLLVPVAGLRNGFGVGALVAFSLSVGLGALVPMALAGSVLVAEYVIDRPMAARRLGGFALGLVVVTPVLFAAGQPVWAWGRIECDRLSLPYLAAIMAGAVALFVMLALRHRVARPLPRVALLGLLTLLAGAALWPFAQACSGGPFTGVSDAVRREVLDVVTENTPAARLLSANPQLAAAILLPQALVTIICACMAIFAGRDDRRGLVILTCFLLLGALGALFQFRAMVWGGAVQALAIGIILSRLSGKKALVALPVSLALLVALFSPLTLVGPFLPRPPSSDGQARSPAFSLSDRACMGGELLSQLDALPKGVVLNPLNLGAPILLYTHHSVLSAPYHRSGKAMLNGLRPFQRSPEYAHALVLAAGADYLVLCDDPGRDLAATALRRQLLAGDLPDWLEPIEGVAPPLLAFRITP